LSADQNPPRFRLPLPLLLAGTALALAAPVQAQDVGGDGLDGTAFDGDWLAVGVGVGVGPSYAGSNDYAVFPFPLVIGRLGGVGISARPSGAALDLLPRQSGELRFSLGPSLRLRSNRASDPKDPVVAALPRLKRSVDLGPSGGVSFPGIVHRYDSLSVSLDTLWDVGGTHGGMTISPSVTYFTPLGKGAAVALTLDADHGDRQFMDYYYSVEPAASAASGLSEFEAEGGWYRAGAYLVGGIDLNGSLADGGFAVFGIAAWSRMLGDAKASPFTSERGNADQFVGAVGVGYTF
jgi:outer membrane protein